MEMDIGTEIAAALPILRAQAESMMDDECVIKILIRHDVDLTTGASVPVYGPRIYPSDETLDWGRCKAQDGARSPRESAEGDADRDAFPLRVDVPMGPPWIPEGAVVTMSDGRRFRVLAPHRKTHQTAQRLPVEQVL